MRTTHLLERAAVVTRGFILVPSLLALGLASCSSTYPVVITSEPPGAMVQVNGQNAGNAPFAQTFDFGSQTRAVVTGSMPGYFPEEVILSEASLAVTEGELKIVLLEDQAWNVTTTSEATNAWLRVQIEDSLADDDLWQKLIDGITDRYASLEQMDRTSGYIRTIYQVRTFRGRRGNFRVRNRFICTVATREPLTYKMKVEADATNASGNWIPYNRIFKEDAAMVEELQSRLGIK